MEDLFTGGHNACPGCGAAILMRHITRVFGRNAIIVQATGCMEVVSTLYPYTAWKVPYIHVAFENAAAVASGIYRALKVLGKDKEVRVVAIGGDGGTFDIGFQALSGMVERGEKVVYICYDNEAYMNTGIQRSSATPKYAWTTTTPVGKESKGKIQWKKPIALVIGAHGNVYSATASIAFLNDLHSKLEKAKEFDGPAFIHVLTPCPTGWKFPSDLTIEVARLAVETCMFPLFEIEDGILRVTYKDFKKKPVEEYLKLQRRFRHLTEEEIKEIQAWIDRFWEYLLSVDGKRVFPF